MKRNTVAVLLGALSLAGSLLALFKLKRSQAALPDVALSAPVPALEAPVLESVAERPTKWKIACHLLLGLISVASIVMAFWYSKHLVHWDPRMAVQIVAVGSIFVAVGALVPGVQGLFKGRGGGSVRSVGIVMTLSGALVLAGAASAEISPIPTCVEVLERNLDAFGQKVGTRLAEISEANDECRRMPM